MIKLKYYIPTTLIEIKFWLKIVNLYFEIPKLIFQLLLQFEYKKIDNIIIYIIIWS